jgi:hypothetical protein
LATVVHRFADGDFPLFEAHTTVAGPVLLTRDAGQALPFQRVAYVRADNDPPRPEIVLALPLVKVDGVLRKFVLTVRGDASGARLEMDAGDASGDQLRYDFGIVGFDGWRALSSEARRGGDKSDRQAAFAPPICPLRLRIVLPETCARLDLGLGELSVTGAARVSRGGLGRGCAR